MNNLFSIDLRVCSDRIGEFRIGFDEASRTVWSIYRPDSGQIDDSSRRLLPDNAATLKEELMAMIETPDADSPNIKIIMTLTGNDGLHSSENCIPASLFRKLALAINVRLREPLVEDIADYIMRE